MKRRNFIKQAGTLASTPFVLNGLGISAMSKPWYFDSISAEIDKVLVLIRLSGGNDGLNTLIPLDQYGNLFNARQNILIPENNIMGITDTLGLHPSMGGMRNLFDDGHLGIVQSVGYPNQNRSHFKSMQVWYTGQPEQSEQGTGLTGWLGRHLDEEVEGFPYGYPNQVFPDPFAIAMGDYVSETCQGQAANYSIALHNPFELSDLAEWGGSNFGGLYGDELAFLRDKITQTNSYFGQIETAVDAGANEVNYPQTEMGQHLKHIARMISGGLETKIYTVNLSGFDTHANQVSHGQPLTGMHAELLQTVSDALQAFQEDLVQQGLNERVIGMTFSEFGRQIRSNSSRGTDHGTAAPLFLFGSCINPGILGENPEIPDSVEPQEGVPMQYDFRDVYGSVLMDWFEVPEDTVRGLLYDGFQHLPIVSGCEAPVSAEDSGIVPTLRVRGYPNPFRETATIEFSTTEREWIRLAILNPLGQEVSVLFDRRVNPGEHQVSFDGSHLPAGNYYFRLTTRSGQAKTRLLAKSQ